MLDLEIHPFINRDLEKDDFDNIYNDTKERLAKIEKIKLTGKPIEYTYLAGFSNWQHCYETKGISTEEFTKMVLSRKFGYLIKEKEDKIMIKRIENYY